MATHSTTRLANGHTLTIVSVPGPNAHVRIDERNELGTWIRFAWSGRTVGEAAIWVERQATRLGRDEGEYVHMLDLRDPSWISAAEESRQEINEHLERTSQEAR